MSAMAPDTIGDLGSILGVWAHPDDEAWLSAGLMARAVDAGRRVVCVTATAGEAGFPDGDPRPNVERMAIRRAEMAASLGEVGVTEHHWLGYRDGHCDEIADEEAV
ncbi:MAG TPA: PIG-L family deacetylase, partial [Thermomicrobiales bacterium]|nr:PIG-L family deacetylase [Thermomicrobiales bacterium]